jgi:hypothetical protein
VRCRGMRHKGHLNAVRSRRAQSCASCRPIRLRECRFFRDRKGYRGRLPTVAYDTTRKGLKIHVSRDHSYDTLGWIGDILSTVEYTYNVAAVLTLLNQSFHDDRMPEIASTLDRSNQFGFSTLNLSLREFIPPEAQARLVSLRVVNSIEIGLDGLGDAINAVAEDQRDDHCAADIE